MTWLKSVLAFFKGKRKNKAPAEVRPHEPQPLREFVYLDEVSLRSLLSSQQGEITDATSQQVADSLVGEVGTKTSADAQVLKGELTSRFQTTNSSTLQTSRKATVQSWFREFHAMRGLRLITPPQAPVVAVREFRDLAGADDKSISLLATDLRRGDLVEFRVQLAADPVFRLGTMVTEFAGMADDYPDMFGAGNNLAQLQEFLRVNKILQRLLAGLIPVRAVALDYAVIKIGDDEYVVHKDAVANLALEQRSLEIVGVTEHMAYWKDIRRVLFSEAEFTLLCRVARSGLNDSWTPVKLAEMFRDLTPDLVDQINQAGRIPLGSHSSNAAADTRKSQLTSALHAYKTSVLSETKATLTPEQDAEVLSIILDASERVGSVSDQRSAFALVGQLLASTSKTDLDPTRDLELREAARTQSGLSLFPMIAAPPSSPSPAPLPPSSVVEPRVLDVEVIAIYW